MGVKTVSEARCGSDMCTLLHQNDVVAVVVVEINSIQFNSNKNTKIAVLLKLMAGE